MQGSSIIQYDGDMGEVWDRGTFFFERKDWTNEDWGQDWSDNVYAYGIRTTFFQRATQHYRIQPEATNNGESQGAGQNGVS
jgi:hypothetical protein